MSETAFISMPFGKNPSSPENEWTKLYEHGLCPLEKPIDSVDGYEPITLFRADRTLVSLGLKSNVKDLIEQSTIVIAVLTTSDLGEEGNRFRVANPNVLWEVGYAEALGKPVVVLADDESLRDLPALAGVPNVCLYDHEIVRRVKPKDAATGLTMIPRDLAPYVMQACENARRGHTGDLRTRATAYPDREAIGLAELISGARKHVDILTTNLDYFLFSEETHDPFEAALASGASIRLVTMDPESVIAEYRAKQLGRQLDIPGYRSELRDGIMSFLSRFGHHPHFSLHLYNDLPLQITIRVDQTVITSIVTRGDRARKRIQIRFSLYDEGVNESFISHFQSIYSDSTDIRGIAWAIRKRDEILVQRQRSSGTGTQSTDEAGS